MSDAPVIEIPWEPAQVAIYAILSTYFQARDPKVPVYDQVPADATPPYIEIGAHRWRAENTKTESGWMGGPEVLVWSTKPGLKEAAQLAAEAATAISAPGAVEAAIPAGWDGYLMDIEQANSQEIVVQGTVETQGIVIPRIWMERAPV